MQTIFKTTANQRFIPHAGGICGVLACLATPNTSEAAPEFPAEVFEHLDYGIYWFGEDEAYAKDEGSGQNPFFSPSAPTMIFTHGWQAGMTETLTREAFDWSRIGAPAGYLAQAWIDAGWNVGVMYWNQMADETWVSNAEAKIWTAQGPKGMRWRDANGDYHEDGPARPVGELFYEAYQDALLDYTGDTIRIVGHSLGSQLAVSVTQHIVGGVEAGDLPDHLLPSRVTLLDPFFSDSISTYLGFDGSTTDLGRQAIELGRDFGVLYETYRSSIASQVHGDIIDLTAYVELKPWYFDPAMVVEKHISASWHYFWSFQFHAPPIRDSPRPGLSAAASNARVREFMDSANRLSLEAGMHTETPADDVLELVPR